MSMLVFTLSYNLFFKKVTNVAKLDVAKTIFKLKVGSSIWCYRKSKTLADEKQEKQEKQDLNTALELVDECLDVYSLVRELCLLKMLLNYAVDKKTQDSVPLSLCRLRQLEKGQGEVDTLQNNHPIFPVLFPKNQTDLLQQLTGRDDVFKPGTRLLPQDNDIKTLPLQDLRASEIDLICEERLNRLGPMELQHIIQHSIRQHHELVTAGILEIRDEEAEKVTSQDHNLLAEDVSIHNSSGAPN